MNELTIGEVARLAGIQTSAIRYYESKGLLPRPGRVSGQRRYDSSVLKRLGLIQLSQKAGFRLRELQILFSHMDADALESGRWQTLAAQKIDEIDAAIERSQAARAWLVAALQNNCSGVEDCITLSFDETENGVSMTLICKNSQLNSIPSL